MNGANVCLVPICHAFLCQNESLESYQNAVRGQTSQTSFALLALCILLLIEKSRIFQSCFPYDAPLLGPGDNSRSFCAPAEFRVYTQHQGTRFHKIIASEAKQSLLFDTLRLALPHCSAGQ